MPPDARNYGCSICDGDLSICPACAVEDERHAVVLRLQQRAIGIRTLGKKYRWAAAILDDEARAITKGKHRE